MKNEILWGFHPVYEALRAGRRKLHNIYVVPDKVGNRFETLLNKAQHQGIHVENVSLTQLSDMVGHKRHQGICAKASKYPLSSIDEILGLAKAAGQAPFVLVLDQVVDPQNLGAIARTAHCAGIHGMVVPKKSSAPPSAAASKSSAGALEYMHIAYVTNLVNALKHLQKEGLWITGSDQNGEGTVFDADLSGPLGIVVGGEEKGIRPLVKRHCDFLIMVPQTGSIESLNVSAAAAVVIYEAFRQRGVSV